MARFKFPLQPALDKARADREKAEKALLEARRDLAEAEARLATAKKKLADTLQQAQTTHDHLVSPDLGGDSPNDLLHRRELLGALRTRATQEQHAVREQQGNVAAAKALATQRQHELNQTVAQVQSFEKLEDKARREHQKILDRKLQEEIDESAQRRPPRN